MKKLIKVSDHIYMYKFETRRDRPNLYYIKGDNYSVCVDAGTSKNHLYEFYRSIMREGFKLPKYTIITHWHWDHTFALNYIAGLSISSKLTFEKLKQVSEWKWDLDSMKQRLKSKEDIKFCDKCIKREYTNLEEIEVVVPDIAIKNKSLNLGGVNLRLTSMDTPHSRDGLLVECIDDKILIVGDADCGDDYFLNSNYDVSKTKKLLKYYKKVKPSLILLGHDMPQSFDEEVAYLEEVINNKGIVG